MRPRADIVLGSLDDLRVASASAGVSKKLGNWTRDDGIHIQGLRFM